MNPPIPANPTSPASNSGTGPPSSAIPSPHEAASLWSKPEDPFNLDDIVIDDGKPVDNIFSEKQMRLLTEPLQVNWSGPGAGRPFVVMANVGVFPSRRESPIVPDVLLAVGVKQGSDPSKKENLSYFMWLRGKPPDVAIEIVSNYEGGEDTDKIVKYAQIRVPYYVVFDPENYLDKGVLRVFVLRNSGYRPLPEPWFLEDVGLGVCLWVGRFEDMNANWLRWCDRERRLIPTGGERADQEKQRADQEKQRADEMQRELEQLKAQIRAKGFELPS